MLSRLPKLLDVDQLSPRVLRILGQNAGKFTLQGTNTYIVGTGRQRLIIDTAQGYRAWADLIEETLHERSIELSHVFLTHWHGDHTKGVPDLLRLYPYLADSIYKNSPDNSQQPIEDGQIFAVEGATIRAVHAPGHSHDHMCFVLEEENALFTGDNVLGHGTSAVEHLGVYMDALRKMQAQGCVVGYPAHGAVISDLPGKIEAEIGQKTRREKQCLVALDRLHREKGSVGQAGSVTVNELIDTIHGNQLNEQVRTKVIGPFMDEVLCKLAEDGKVGFCVRKGVKKWFSLITG
ncbi:hypothetical protein VI817_001309 [Penicillium citrinum]|nr:hypothetical protein VI817_001309 [Penicillium citrinum]